MRRPFVNPLGLEVYEYVRDLRKKIAVAKATGVEKQLIEAAELKLQQNEALIFVVDVAAGLHAIEKEAACTHVCTHALSHNGA